jgi:hypothetical protein
MKMRRTEEIEDQVRNLTRTVDEMRSRIAELEGREPNIGNGTGASSRRGFLRLGAAAALGAVGLAASKAVPATAANGGNFVLGSANLAASSTTIQGDVEAGPIGPPTRVLAAEDAAFSSASLTNAGGFLGTLQGLGGASGVIEGVDGWAQGAQAFAVYGLTDSGTGVVGESATGIGLYSRRSGRIRQDGLATPGMPAYTPNDFEQVRDSTGVLWISTAGGTWRQVMTADRGLHLFPNPRRIYDGFAQPTAPGTYGPIDATVSVSPAGPSGVPAGAQAAFCAVQSFNAGVMTLFPDLAADPGIASWSGTANGPLNLLYMFVPLSPAGKFKIHTYFTGQKFIDAWGYLV